MRALEMSEPATRRAIAAFNRGKSGSDNLRGYMRRSECSTPRGRRCVARLLADGLGRWPRRGQLSASCSPSGVSGWAGRDNRCRRWPPIMSRGKRPSSAAAVSYQEAMRLLGVSATSEPAQIKRAYRRLLSRHHPDKIAGSGATAMQVREATDKTRELHNAYTLIRERRDFR